MILSDQDLEQALASGELKLEPLAEDAIQPASIDLRMGGEIGVAIQDASFESRPTEFLKATIDPFPPGPEEKGYPPLGPRSPRFERIQIAYGGGYSLAPGQFILGCTQESIALSSSLVARVEGRSTLGRMGLLIHATAGFIDPGFSGILTLEIYNASRNYLILRPGMPIAQLAVERLATPARRPYGDKTRRSKYQGQEGAQPPRELNEKRENV